MRTIVYFALFVAIIIAVPSVITAFVPGIIIAAFIFAFCVSYFVGSSAQTQIQYTGGYPPLPRKLPPHPNPPQRLNSTQHWPQRCHLCNTDMESPGDRTEWHGIGNCVPICLTCTGSGEQAPAVGMRVTLANGQRHRIASSLPTPEYEILRANKLNLYVEKLDESKDFNPRYFAPIAEFQLPPCPACKGKGYTK